MNRAEARHLLERVSAAWVDDPDSDVVWAGAHEGRWGVRMSQQAREATTTWFDVGDHTVGFEAYLLPKPSHHADEVYRHCLIRNDRSWPATIAIDRRGDLNIVGRIPLAAFDDEHLEQALGAVYEVVELSFRRLVATGYAPLSIEV
jgi:hypothetical protein